MVLFIQATSTQGYLTTLFVIIGGLVLQMDINYQRVKLSTIQLSITEHDTEVFYFGLERRFIIIFVGVMNIILV